MNECPPLAVAPGDVVSVGIGEQFGPGVVTGVAWYGSDRLEYHVAWYGSDGQRREEWVTEKELCDVPENTRAGFRVSGGS